MKKIQLNFMLDYFNHFFFMFTKYIKIFEAISKF